MRILATLPIENGAKTGLQIISVIISFIFVIWCIAAFGDDQSIKNKIISTILAIASIVSVFMVGIKVPDYKPNQHRYYIEITDNNKETEILKDYILEDTIGIIYVVRDK